MYKKGSFSDWCVVNVAIGSWYVTGQCRMLSSLRAHGYKGEALLWKDSLPTDCPEHEITPYAFKVFAIQEAIDKGFKKIAWIDSSIVAVNSLSPIEKWLATEPVYMHSQPSTMIGNWASDASIQYLGLNREAALHIHSLDASILFFDFTKATAKLAFKRWQKAAIDGIAFRGSHRNDEMQVSEDKRVYGHRHDQTVLSIILWQEGIQTFKWSDSITRHAKRYKLQEKTIFVCRRKCYKFETHGAVGTLLWRMLYHPQNALRRILECIFNRKNLK